MQSKNKIENNLFHPRWQLAGIFITAAILGIIQLRWTEQYMPGADANLAYGAITFFSVLLVYSIDHLFDLIKYESKYERVSHIQVINIVVAIVSSVGIAVFLAVFTNVIDFSHFWIPVLPAFIYAIITMRMLPHIRGLKEFVIAVTVAVSLCYPFIQGRFDVFIQLAPAVFLVCYMNVLLFSFFEKPKDDHFGFNTVYKEKSEFQALKHIMAHFIAASLGLAGLYFFMGSMVFPFFAIAVLYWLMIAAQKQLINHPVYRWLADIILLIMVF